MALIHYIANLQYIVQRGALLPCLILIVRFNVTLPHGAMMANEQVSKQRRQLAILHLKFSRLGMLLSRTHTPVQLRWTMTSTT